MWGENEDMGLLGGVLDMGATLAAIGVVLALVLFLVPLILTPAGLVLAAFAAACLVGRRCIRRKD